MPSLYQYIRKKLFLISYVYRMLRIQKRQKKDDYVFNRTDNLAMPKKLYKPKPKKVII